MNVGIVTTWFERGAAIVSRQIMYSLSNGHDVYVYARGEKYAKGDPRWDLENVHWGKRVHWPGSGKMDRTDYLCWLQYHEIDVVIFNEQRWWEPILWTKDAGLKVGAYIDYYTADSVPLFAAYDFLICNTKRHHSVFQWHSGSHLVPWGTDVELYSPSESYEVAQGPVTFFHSAGMAPYRKGTDILLAAFEAVRQSIEARLIVHSQVRLNLTLPKGTEVIEGTVAPPGLYHLGDVYVYPSRLDGIGLTVCEALSCGLPVITTDCEPMSEFVAHKGVGRLVPVSREFRRDDGYYWPITEADVGELVKAMVSVASDIGRLRSMKRNAREYAVRERSWERNAGRIATILVESRRTRLSNQLRKDIRRHDRRGLVGKLDVLIRVPGVSWVCQSLFRAYRRLSQPHLYRDG